MAREGEVKCREQGVVQSAECGVRGAECGAGAGMVRRVVGVEAELART